MARRVFTAFDTDNAGIMAAAWWNSVLPNAERLIPSEHDLTDMAKDGHNFRSWLGIEQHTPAIQQVEQQTMFDTNKIVNPYGAA